MEPALLCSASEMTVANNYNDWTFSLFREFVRGKVLEVGCGVGSFTSRIEAGCQFDELLSIDLSPLAVEYCSARPHGSKVQFRCADVRDVQGQFDFITCMNVLEHIEDDVAALRGMLNLLAPGGVLFLLVPAHRFLFSAFDAAVGHFRRYDRQGLRKTIAAASRSGEISCHDYYFNTVGALGWFVVYKLFRKNPRAGSASEIGFFDRFVVPVLRRIEGRRAPFGISIVTVIVKGREG